MKTTFKYINITLSDEKRYPYHTAEAIIAIKRMKKMSTERLALILNDKETFNRFHKSMGWNTNPSWITARVAETLYDRNQITQKEFDWITS